MEALLTTEARRVPTAPDILQAGDYCLVKKQEPIRTYETVNVEPPLGFWRVLAWQWFGTKQTTKETVVPQWPECDVIVMACPHCSQPLATTKEHDIMSIEPLTVDKPIACVYSRGLQRDSLSTVFFEVKDGKIMPA